MVTVSKDFGEGLLKQYGKLMYVSTAKSNPEISYEQWKVELLLDTLYVISIDGDPKAWSNDPSIFKEFQTDEFDKVTLT